jgi:hypothetical protein
MSMYIKLGVVTQHQHIIMFCMKHFICCKVVSNGFLILASELCQGKHGCSTEV